jgi:septum site-determining protein MinD
MSRIIVIKFGKGGVGKTTTTSNIGIALAKLEQRVLLLDADVGLKNLDLLLGLENRIVYNGLDVLNGECRLTQALIQDKRQPNLTFFPLSSNQLKLPVTKEQINDLVDQLKNNYDFILIDSPAGIEDGFLTAVEPAKEAIIVTTPEVTSIRDADRVVGILRSRGMAKINLIVNRVRLGMVERSSMMSTEDVSSILGLSLLGVIPDSEAIIIAANRGAPITSEDNTKSKINQAFEIIAKRLNGEDIDFMTFAANAPSSKNIIKNLLKNIIKP